MFVLANVSGDPRRPTRRRIWNLLSLLAVSALAITAPASAGRQPVNGQPQPSGSARLTGRVVAADNGQPVRHAYVTLSRLPTAQERQGSNFSRNVETDVKGDFAFADLPAGSYHVRVDEATGFVRLPQPMEETLSEGRTVEMTVRLERAGAIEGRIRDESGGGMSGVQVHAVRRLTASGHTTLAWYGALATTNDLGDYRLFNLPAGDYYVVVTDMRARRQTNFEPRSGYPDTYFPGTSTLRDARVIVVRAGRDRKGVNVTLAPCRLVSLSIHAADSSGVPLGREAQVTLTKRGDVYLDSSMRQTSRREDGIFLFDGLQPGDYYLVAATSARMEEAAYVNVSMAGADVSLNVQTNAGAQVSGRILVDGRPAASGGPNIWISANPPLGTLGVTYARVPLAYVRQTDRFELAGLRGPMVLSGEVALGALLSIQHGGQEIAGKTLEFVGTERLDDVVVEFTTHVAQVDVTVRSGSAHEGSERVLVIVFAEDPKRWHQGFLQYARTTASSVSAGAKGFSSSPTRLIRMPAGRYLVAAIPDADISYPTDVSMLEKLRPLAAPVELVAGQTAAVTVGVTEAKR